MDWNIFAVGVTQEDVVLIFVDSRDLAKDHRGVLLPSKNSPDRRSDLTRCEDRCRYLIKQRLKEVMIGAVYQSDARRSISKRPGRRQPSESCADNNNLDLSHRLPLGSLGDCDLRRSGEVRWTFLEKRSDCFLAVLRADSYREFAVLRLRGFQELFAPGLFHEPLAGL